MERVVGIGGTFLRARDPDALLAWYAEHLGIELSPWGGHVFEAGRGDATVWSLFPAGTEYFGRTEQQVMLNYRVRDLDAMLAQLRASGDRGCLPGRRWQGCSACSRSLSAG